MKYEEFFKILNEENVKLAINSAFTFNGEVNTEIFNHCFEISEMLDEVLDCGYERIANILSIMPAGIAKATILISQILNLEKNETLKLVSLELNNIYTKQFNKSVEENSKELVSYTDENINEYKSLNKRIVDSVEIIAIAKNLNIDINKFILGKYEGEDKRINLLNQSKHKLNTGETYKLHIKTINELFPKLFKRVKKDLNELKKENRKEL